MRMTSDERFRAAFDNLTARLNRDVARHLDSAVEELTAKAEKLAAVAEIAQADALEHRAREAWAEAEKITAERLTAALAAEHAQLMERASREAWADAERVTSERLAASYETSHTQALRDAQAEAEHATSARLAAALAEAEARARTDSQDADIGAGDRLVEAFRAIDSGQSLSDILNTLVTAATAEAPRVALFLIQNAQFRSLRRVGFETYLATSDEIDISTAGAAMLADAARARTSVVAGDGATVESPAFAQLPPGRGAVAVPLVINDEVAAVLYADQGVEGEVDRQSWPATIEVLTRHASRALEALTAQRLARTLADRPGASRPRSVPKPPADAP